MRLFTLFISYPTGGHYCGVYPSLEHLHGVIREMAEDEKIDKSEIPDLKGIVANVTGNNSEDFWHVFSNGTWVHVQETNEQLVEVILNNYFEKFYSDLLVRITTDRASVTTHLPDENQTKKGNAVDTSNSKSSVVCKSCGHDLTQALILYGTSVIEYHRSLHDRSAPSIICAAIWYDDKITTHKHQPKNIISGYVVAGRRHHNCIAIHSILSAQHSPMCAIQGFLTSDDRFVCREEAGEIAFKARQIPTPTAYLMSEDLY